MEERIEREIDRCEAWLKEAIEKRDRLAETGTQEEHLQACKDVAHLEERLGEAKDDYAQIYLCTP